MSDINTNLDRAPYFDDYLENKKFYRVLFKPGTPVQARELSQLQTMLQKQINRFGSHVFKNGSIVDGVNPTVVQNAHVVRVRNAYTNNNVVDLDKILASTNNLVVTSQSSDVEAVIHFVQDGSQAETPNTKRLYVSYTQTDDTNTKTASGNVSVTINSNTVTGTGTSFNSYAVGDYFTIFETSSKLRESFQAKIASIANNTSMNLNSKLSFSNSEVTSTNFTIHRNLTKFGVLGTENSPEILDIVERTVRNSQSNTVNTSLTSNTFLYSGFTVANTDTVSVFLNDNEMTKTNDFTANTTAVKFKFDLKSDDTVKIVEALNTTKFAGLQTYKSGDVVTSEECTLARNEEGVVFHKGQFLNIDPGFVVVADNKEGANNSIVAVDSNETIVTYKSDTSLLDNSAGFENEVSPGADRLKIDPLLVSANTSNLINRDAVAVLINFGDEGDVLRENRRPEYNILGKELAERKNDTSGSFTINRFVTNTEADSSNNELIKVVVEPGLGYVDGFRVETLAPIKETMERGTNTLQREDFEMNVNYGNYVRVKEFNGNFAPYDRVTFVHNGHNNGFFPASNTTFLTSLTGQTPSSSNNVGRAFVKSVELETGTPGSRDAIYRIHLFGLEQSSNDSISAARTIVTNDTVKGGADIVLNNDNDTVITNIDVLPLSTFGEEAVRSYTDSTGTFDNNFTVRKFASVTDTLNANGFLIVDVDDETDLSGNNAIGSYTTGEVNDLILSNVGSEISCNSTGTTTSSGNVITLSAGFSANIHVGDIVQIDSGNKIIVTKINSSTEIQTNIASTDTTGTLKKVIPVGKTIPVDSAMVSTSQADNTLIIKIPTLNNSDFTGSTTIRASYDFNGRDYKPFNKDIKKDVYRRINTANNSANSVGPWGLGVVDVHKVTGVWVLANKNNGNANDTFTSADLTTSSNKVNGGFFEFDSGQRDHFYDFASLHLTHKGRVKNFVTSNNTIVVQMDAFTVDDNDGRGYFTVDSYPATTEATANSTTIKFEEIPTYISSSDSKFNLRNFVDHRPRYNNVENTNLLTGVANTSIVDPSNVKDKDSAKASGSSKNSSLIFKNDTEFVSDYKVNTPKRADVYLGQSATVSLSVANGSFSEPTEVPAAMKVASVFIPPYPSLTEDEARSARNIYSGGKLNDKKTDFDPTGTDIRVDTFNIRRYTMKDIGTLDSRIQNLEYYVSLNALENEAFNKQIKNNSGIERFKNGLFVEPFISHQFGDTRNSEYKVSIDAERGHFRPNFKEVLVDNFNADIQSGNIEVTGQRVMFTHTEEDFIKQDKATKVRPAAPVATRFIGDLRLFPEYDVGVDSETVGSIILNPDEQPPVQEGSVTRFGRWRTTEVRSSRSRDRITTTRTQSRQARTTITTVNETLETVGSRLQDVSITPFIRELAIGFIATGLRPKEQHSLFFNNVNVNEHVEPSPALLGRPVISSTQIRSQRFTAGRSADQREATDSSSSDNAPIRFRRSRRGNPLITNSDGSVAGVFFVPKDTFLQGDRIVQIADVQDLEVEADAVISSASKMFRSSRIGVKSIDLQERNFEIEQEVVVTNQRRRNTSTTERNRRRRNRPPDPIAQSFYIRDDQDLEDDGVFLSSLDLFFKKKSTKNAVSVFVCPLKNGYPDTTKIYGATKVRLNPASVNVSDDASIATNFKFKYPVFLKKGTPYAFVVKPDRDDPDYDVYFSQLGGNDITTGTAVNSQPYMGIAFLGANLDTWSALQDEDIKFTLKRAKFDTGSAVLRMIPRTFDSGEYEDITYFNNHTSIRVGDFVYGMTNANNDPNLTVANVNTSIFGVVSQLDTINEKIRLIPTTGNIESSASKTFSTTLLNGNTKNTTKHKIAFYRPTDSLTDTETLNIDKFVGTSFMSLEDHEFSAIVPQFTSGSFARSSLDFNFKYNISNTSSTSFKIPNEGEYEYTDNPLVLRSRTNENLKLGSATSNSSFYIDIDMVNNSSKTSPFVDLRRTLLTAVGNLTITPDDNANNFIDGTSVGTDTSASIYSEMFPGLGESNARYISTNVTLADGQDAEDMRILVDAFKPPRGKMYVFGRFINQYDQADQVLFTPLKDLTPEVNSSRNDREDIKEFEFRMFTRDELNNTEWVKIFDDATGSDYAFKYTQKYSKESLMATNNTTGVAEYTRDGTTYKTYKQFQLKIVTYATIDSPAGFGNENSSNPVVVDNLRAIALQV